MRVSLCTYQCVCPIVSVCVSVWQVVTLLQTVQIYLYANWILVKRAGGLRTG